MAATQRGPNNRYITIDGETKTLYEWADESGNCPTLIWHRLRMGWDPDIAVYKLPRVYNKHGKCSESK